MTHRGVIQRGELNLRLARGLELRQAGGEGLLLADQVVPIVTLEDLTKQSLAVEPGVRRAYMCTGVIGAQAGQFGAGVILNPVGSGVLLVIRGFHASAAATGQHVIGLVDPLQLPAGVVTPWWSDPRTSGIPLATVRSGTPGQNIVVTELTRVVVGATTMQSPILWPQDFAVVLTEGQAFGLQDTVASQATTISIIWDEIPIR